MSELLALGMSHWRAPVALRERLAFTATGASSFAKLTLDSPEVREVVVLSTCNRTEVYLAVGNPARAQGDVLTMLARHAGKLPMEIAESIYSLRDTAAARQLYRVTAGLDSMIPGEHEIQGQVKIAYDAALAAGTTGVLCNRLFTTALMTGKRVRAETGIGDNRVSVSSVAVDLCRDVLGSLADRYAVILGAGETSELTTRALAEQGAGTIFVANRHADRAGGLAERFGGSVVGLDRLPDQLERADIVLCSTSSPHPIVGYEELEQVAQARAGRPLLLIDIAVPRDVEERCGELAGVTLYDIDDLQSLVARNLDTRAEEARKGEEIVEEEIRRFARWLGQLETLPTVAALRAHGDTLVERVLSENEGRWESASPRDLERIESIARAVCKRLLHEPTLRLRELDGEGGRAILQVARELFGLEPEAASAHKHSAGLAIPRRPADAPTGGAQELPDVPDNVRSLTPRSRAIP